MRAIIKGKTAAIYQKHGCKNCGYSFCKDCLTKKVAVPKYKNEKHKVCNSCYNILTGQTDPSKSNAKYSPPEALRKRLAALDNKDGKPVPKRSQTTLQERHQTNNKYKGMSKEDIAMADRLEKLKEARRKEAGPIPSQKQIEERLGDLKDKGPPPPGEQDMAARLAMLKGQDPNKATKPFVYKQDKRSEQQQIDDLLDEICDEVEIDSHSLDPVTDIDTKLRKLKGDDIQNNLNKSENDAEKKFNKNIPFVSSEDKTASGEEVNIDDMNRLMMQVADEMEVDAQRAIAGLQRDKELMDRLNQLKKDRKKNNKSSDKSKNKATDSDNNMANEDISYDSEDENEAIKKILKRALEENRLDEELSASGYDEATSKKAQKNIKEKDTVKISKPKVEQDNEQESDPDELPWCCICNEDATIRCVGCDYDLYCNRCFKDGHDKYDMEDHKTMPFKQKKKK